MRIPRRMLIKGEVWKVCYRKNLKLDGEDCTGLCDAEKRIIYLKKHTKDYDLSDIFFHEYLHAVMHELHIDMNGDVEEIIVEGMSKCIMDAFELTTRRKRNKGTL
jgi:hypothetical protein